MSIPSNPDGTIDQVIVGELIDGELRLETDNSLYDDHTFVASAGWTVEIDMRSDAFDTYLMLLAPDGEILRQNDDGGDGQTNSHIAFRVLSDGTYTVRANAFYETGRGEYQLHVRARP